MPGMWPGFFWLKNAHDYTKFVNKYSHFDISEKVATLIFCDFNNFLPQFFNEKIITKNLWTSVKTMAFQNFRSCFHTN